MGTESVEGEGNRCLILGGGEIADRAGLLERAVDVGFVICADSGYNHCGALGLTPQLLVGDFDSLQGALPEGVPHIDLEVEKDYTDMALAIDEALERGYRSLLLAGSMGGRLDHTLANIQSAAALSAHGVQAQLTDGATDIWALTDGEQILQPRERTYFSLFAVGGDCQGVDIRGAKYPLTDFTLRATDPRAVSNEFVGRPVTIGVIRGTLLIVQTPMDR